MKKIILSSLLAISFTANANVLVDMKRCSTIENNTDRLDCFDNVSAHYNKQRNSLASVETLPAKPQTNSNSVTDIDNQTSKEIINISKEDAFGKSTSEISELESIKSNIEGEFKGWNKGDVITLANGQKWKVTSNKSGYVNLQNPPVEITKGFWGSFNMKVTGLNAQGKVKRVK